MEFAVVNTTKSAAKTVAVTLTNEEARNPANAFSALLNMGGVRFKAEHGLSQAEGQWMRGQTGRDTDTAPKLKTEDAAKAKEKIAGDEPGDERDDVAAAGQTDNTDDTTANDNAGVSAVAETQPAEQTVAVGLEAIQTVAIQFQILVQLPNGGVQDMGTFDLKALLAAAGQDSSLASALEAAFGQAAAQLEAGQSLLGPVAQTAGVDATLNAELQQVAAATGLEGADTTKIAELFKQIAAALRPIAQQMTTNAANPQAAQVRQAAAHGEAAAATLETQSPEAAQQSAELSKILGDDNKIRIQVAVDGRKVADIPFEWSSFNRFVGYSAEAMRTASTANGQAGQGQATNAAITAEGASPQVLPTASNTGFQNAGTQNGGSGMPRAEVQAARAPEAAAPSNTNSASNSSQSQPTSFATALNQASGNANAQATASAERPAPTQAQQVIEQIKVNITRVAKAGLDRVTIQLRPEELGRIEIKLEMTEEGQVRANVTADNPATLELLQREARGLERALQDAGLRAEASDLEFNLRSQDNDRLTENRDERGGRGQGGESADARTVDEEAANDDYDYALAAQMRGGVDTYA